MEIKSMAKTVGKLAVKQKATVAILAMLVLMLFFPTNFYTAYNLIDLLNSSAILIILAAGVSITVIAGGCDLSIGGVMVTSGIIAIQLMPKLGMFLAILIALLSGVVIGFVNGFLVVQQKTEPFIITLGMGMLLSGFAQQLTNGRAVQGEVPAYMQLANGRILGQITNLVIFMIVVIAAMHYVMRYTTFGRNCYAIGGDYEVARYSGISVIFTKWATFLISGFIAALAGVLLSSKLNSGSYLYGENIALIVNCGCVVGGVSFAGGVGSIPQAALGLLVFGVLENAMNMLGISSYIQILLRGIVIVAIIWLDCFGRKRKRELV